MSYIRIEKLHGEDRENYIRRALVGKEMSELRHMVSEYGVQNSLSMTRTDLENEIVRALCGWEQESFPSYTETLLPVPEYRHIENTCAIPMCKKTMFKGGICSKHWYEYTITGTHYPAWLEMLVNQHRSYERKSFNSETPFSWLEDGGEYIVG